MTEKAVSEAQFNKRKKGKDDKIFSKEKWKGRRTRRRRKAIYILNYLLNIS